MKPTQVTTSTWLWPTFNFRFKTLKINVLIDHMISIVDNVVLTKWPCERLTLSVLTMRRPEGRTRLLSRASKAFQQKHSWLTPKKDFWSHIGHCMVHAPVPKWQIYLPSHDSQQIRMSVEPYHSVNLTLCFLFVNQQMSARLRTFECSLATGVPNQIWGGVEVRWGVLSGKAEGVGGYHYSTPATHVTHHEQSTTSSYGMSGLFIIKGGQRYSLNL